MSQDHNEDLKPLELHPEMQPIEAEAESTASQEPGAYYVPPGYRRRPRRSPRPRMGCIGRSWAWRRRWP